MRMYRIGAIFLILLVFGTFVFLKATENTRATKGASEEASEVNYEIILEEQSSEITSETVSEEPSEETSGEASIEVSDEASEEALAEPSKEFSENQFVEDPSEEVSGEVSIETSDEPSQEVSEETPSEDCPIQIPEGVEVGYIVYDITSDAITSSYNTQKEFRTGCTIKAAYVLWLLNSGEVSQRDMDTVRIPYSATTEGTSVLRNKGTKEGTPISLKTLLEYTIKYSDNDAYCMLTSRYHYTGFNQYMASLGIEVRLGSAETGYNFTSASAEEQLVIWKQITKFCFPADGRTTHEAKVFIDWLFDGAYNFIEQAIPGLETLHMSGWANQSGTMNDCAIVLDEFGNPSKIVIILTSDGVETEDLSLVHKPRFLEIAKSVIDTIIVL